MSASLRGDELKRKVEETRDEDERPLKRERFPELVDLYRPIESLGQGTYAVVWRAISLQGDDKGCEVAVKRFKTQHNKVSRLQNEAEMLIQCRGGVHVVGLHKIVRRDEKIALILPYFPHDSFRDNLHRFDVGHTLAYMCGLFDALAHVHKCRVLHRDVKPSNALYSFAKRDTLLVDFGLAERMREPRVAHKSRAPHADGGAVAASTLAAGARSLASAPRPGMGRRVQYVASATALAPANSLSRHGCPAPRADAPSLPRSRAGTKGFRAPECLMGEDVRTGAVDVWSAGVILLSILSRTYPFFNGADDIDQLWEIAVLRGRKAMQAAARSLGRSFEPVNGPNDSDGSGSHIPDEPRPLEEITTASLDRIPPGPVRAALLSLTEACLDVNPQTRVSAKKAHEKLLLVRAAAEAEAAAIKAEAAAAEAEVASVMEHVAPVEAQPPMSLAGCCPSAAAVPAACALTPAAS